MPRSKKARGSDCRKAQQYCRTGQPLPLAEGLEHACSIPMVALLPLATVGTRVRGLCLCVHITGAIEFERSDFAHPGVIGEQRAIRAAAALVDEESSRPGGGHVSSGTARAVPAAGARIPGARIPCSNMRIPVGFELRERVPPLVPKQTPRRARKVAQRRMELVGFASWCLREISAAVESLKHRVPVRPRGVVGELPARASLVV